MRPTVFVPEPIAACGMELLEAACDCTAPWTEGRVPADAEAPEMLRGADVSSSGRTANSRAGGSDTPVAVLLDPAAAKSSRGRGAVGWGGAFGTTTWTDPELEITAVLMVQQGSQGVVQDFENAVRAAIID